jgi:penicillin amidase
MSKRLSAIGTALGAAIGLLGAGYYWLLRHPLARTQGTLRLPGLKAEVEIIRDRWGVPHIYASNTHDLMFAQGFVHAQDRLWQMEFNRRLVAGRLSEVMGGQTVPVDRWIRTLCMRRVAEQEADLIDGEVRADMEAYCAGVNARIAQGRLPVEFTLLRYKPEPWTLADSLSWNKMMSWSLSINWQTEILRAQLIAHLGPERASELEPDYFDRWPRIVPPGVDFSAIGSAALDRAEEAQPFTGPPAHAGLGSNNWVLAGSHTATGAPLLANDMHLLMGLPCIWYENHLSGEDLNVTGITFPGIPGVIVGHNGHVAWGFTNGFPDVQDLYMERLRRTDDGHVQYEYKGEWLDAEVIQEEIRVRGSETVMEKVVITRHGPIINTLDPDFAGEQPLALRWTSLEPEAMLYALDGMMRARNCLEFREALRHWSAPIQNMVYADTEGNIAYSFPGRLPIRAKGDGQLPVPGWTDEYEWLGYVPFEELPHLYNPPQGYVATANNQVVGDDFPYYISREYAMGDRAQRITELIEAQDKINADYVQRMQFDLISPSARVMSGYLGQLETDDPELAAVVEMMREWDGELAADSPAAAVYQVFTRRMITLTLSDKLGDLTIRYAGKGPTPMLAEGSMFGARSWEWLQKTLAEPDSHWFDLGGGETRDGIMHLALRETVDFLKAELGPEIGDWAWGKLHTLTYAHTLGRVKPLDKLFNRGPCPLGGDGTTLWATGASRHDLSSEGIVGPPFRFVADLGDLRNSLGLLAPGQSGQPGSKHYDDQVQAWFSGEYHPMLYTREDVERETVATLRLLPRGGE